MGAGESIHRQHILVKENKELRHKLRKMDKEKDKGKQINININVNKIEDIPKVLRF